MRKGIEARFLVAVIAYFAVQLGLRLLIGPALELDEAEAFYHSRHLAWGYGPQPPLYFWLQGGLFRVFGEGLFALALLKALILAGTLIALFALLRREAGPGPAAVAALSLSLLPQVMWEGQRALSHSMLALLMAVVTAGLVVRALRTGRWRDHLALGLAVGLGVLSKFNFALWPVGLLAAAGLLAEWRGRVRPGRILAAVAVAVLVVAPVAVWMWRNPLLATGSVGKLAIEEGRGLGARLAGTADLLEAALAFLALAILVLGGFTLVRSRPGVPLPSVARLLGTGAGLSLGLIWVGLLASGSTEVKERWLLPVAWALVPLGVLWLWPRLSERAGRGLAGVVAGLWLLAMAALPYASLVDPGYRGADFGPLVERLRALGAGERGLRVESQWVAGNLAFLAPDLSPRLLGEDGRPGPGTVLVRGEGSSPLSEGGGEAVIVPRGRSDIRVIVAVRE